MLQPNSVVRFGSCTVAGDLIRESTTGSSRQQESAKALLGTYGSLLPQIKKLDESGISSHLYISPAKEEADTFLSVDDGGVTLYTRQKEGNRPFLSVDDGGVTVYPAESKQTTFAIDLKHQENQQTETIASIPGQDASEFLKNALKRGYRMLEKSPINRPKPEEINPFALGSGPLGIFGC